MKSLPQSFQGRKTIGCSRALRGLAAKRSREEALPELVSVWKITSQPTAVKNSWDWKKPTVRHLIKAKSKTCPEDESYCLNINRCANSETPQRPLLASWLHTVPFPSVSITGVSSSWILGSADNWEAPTIHQEATAWVSLLPKHFSVKSLACDHKFESGLSLLSWKLLPQWIVSTA